MELVKGFKTCQCRIEVYDTGFCVDYYHIYMVKSYHIKNGKVVTRFGTKAQIAGMLRCYNGGNEKGFKL